MLVSRFYRPSLVSLVAFRRRRRHDFFLVNGRVVTCLLRLPCICHTLGFLTLFFAFDDGAGLPLGHYAGLSQPFGLGHEQRFEPGHEAVHWVRSVFWACNWVH